MSSKKIGLDGLSYELRQVLKEFEGMSYKAVKNAVRETAETIRKETAGSSPKKTGVYRKNWRVKEENNGGFAIADTVYQQKKPSLTHLLQWGHGGPVRAKGYPHIVPDEETAKLFAAKLMKEMGG